MPVPSGTFKHIFSIGTCCFTSAVIKTFFPSQKRGPFDWLSIPAHEAIPYLLEHRCWPMIVERRAKGCIVHLGPHDAKEVHPRTLCVTKRRVERFNKALDSGESVLLILLGHFDGKEIFGGRILPETISRIEAALRKAYPLCNYTLLVVNERIVSRPVEERYSMIWKNERVATATVMEDRNRGRVSLGAIGATEMLYFCRWGETSFYRKDWTYFLTHVGALTDSVEP